MRVIFLRVRELGKICLAGHASSAVLQSFKSDSMVHGAWGVMRYG